MEEVGGSSHHPCASSRGSHGIIYEQGQEGLNLCAGVLVGTEFHKLYDCRFLLRDDG